MDALGLRRHVARITRAMIATKLSDALALPIDWSQTVAYSGTRTSEGIYINLKGREPYDIIDPSKEYEEVRERIMSELTSLVDPDTGQSVVSTVYRREEIHRGEYLHLMPGIIFSLEDKPYLTSDSTSATLVFEPLAKDDVKGRHHPHGIFAAVGPHIAPGLILEQANIVDVAPTILYAMDLPIPKDMDGRVLEEAFTAEYRQAHPVRYKEFIISGPASSQAYAYNEDEESEIQRRLHDLGYVD